MAPCYPAQTAGPCMRPWQVRALAVLTLALVACWAPLGAARWVAGHRHRW